MRNSVMSRIVPRMGLCGRHRAAPSGQGNIRGRLLPLCRLRFRHHHRSGTAFLPYMTDNKCPPDAAGSSKESRDDIAIKHHSDYFFCELGESVVSNAVFLISRVNFMAQKSGPHMEQK